jgi:hypothetical protein
MLGAMHACLIPIARLLLRSGITYSQFAEVAKRAFVSEAFKETDARGRRTNASRVAAKTGLSRKEVRKIGQALKASDGDEPATPLDNSGPLARVLHTWHVDPRFIGEDGLPLVLPFDEHGLSFSSLVRAVAGDVPAGAVRAELKRAGAIAENDDGFIEVRKRYYVPGNVDEKAITVISGMLFPMAASVEHNANPFRKTDGFIQRFAFSESLSVAAAALFRHWARAESTRFIETIDNWLATNEGAELAEPEHEQKVRAGVGVFYYEGPSAEEVTKGS